MPHQCVRCDKFYEDGDSIVLKGCPCGGRLFFYIKKEKLEQLRKITKDTKLSLEDKKQIEQDVLDLVDIKDYEEQPVVLDIESVRVLEPGKYEIDLVHMFKNEPLIFKIGEGKYIIDLVKSFEKKG